jgi:glycosyltransferase involved in cell wall biosynthesis
VSGARVSVIVPTYNRREMVCEAVESALAQTYGDIEVIVVDNGSTDGTAEAVGQFGSKVRCVRLAIPGLSEARNEGMRQAGGEFIAFLDNDDLWTPDKLERQMPLFRDPATVLVYGDSTFFRRKGEPLGRYSRLHPPARGWVQPDLFMDLFMHPSTLVFRRRVLERAGCFDLRFRIAEEYDFLMRLSEAGAFDFVPEPVAWIRLHAQNESRLRRLRLWQETAIVCGEAVSRRPALRDALGPRYRRRLCRIAVGTAWEHLREGDPAASWAFFRQALLDRETRSPAEAARFFLELAGWSVRRALARVVRSGG